MEKKQLFNFTAPLKNKSLCSTGTRDLSTHHTQLDGLIKDSFIEMWFYNRSRDQYLIILCEFFMYFLSETENVF